MSHKKFGPDRFSRFDVYWIQTDRQTNKQTDKQNLYIDNIYLSTTGFIQGEAANSLKSTGK